jgi:endonuclease/exonuclease/phosphatase family metal-dependent hydrolase
VPQKMNYVYTSHSGMTGGKIGQALLSTFKIDSVETRVISSPGNTVKEHRVQIVTLSIGGKTVTLLNVHTDRDITDGSSELNVAAAITDTNADIVLGDFNTTPSSSTLDPIRNLLVDTTQALGLTGIYTGPKQKAQVDYIFVDDSSFTPTDGDLYPEQYQWVVAVHNAYYANLDIK